MMLTGMKIISIFYKLCSDDLSSKLYISLFNYNILNQNCKIDLNFLYI